MCHVVTLGCLLAISSHLKEANFNHFVSTLTQRLIIWKFALIFFPVLEVEPVKAG